MILLITIKFKLSESLADRILKQPTHFLPLGAQGLLASPFCVWMKPLNLFGFLTLTNQGDRVYPKTIVSVSLIQSSEPFTRTWVSLGSQRSSATDRFLTEWCHTAGHVDRGSTVEETEIESLDSSHLNTQSQYQCFYWQKIISKHCFKHVLFYPLSTSDSHWKIKLEYNNIGKKNC
jgi:hypothetical protein